MKKNYAIHLFLYLLLICEFSFANANPVHDAAKRVSYDSGITVVETYSVITFDDLLSPGDEIHFIYTIQNTGDETLYNVTVVEGVLINGVEITFDPFTLAPGETATKTGLHTITEADITATQVTSQITALGYNASGDLIAQDLSGNGNSPALDNPTVVLLHQPKLRLIKTGFEAGGMINYNFSVTNTGNLPITNILVFDAMLGSTFPLFPAALLPGETGEVWSVYMVTPADYQNGAVVNSAIVSGSDPSNNYVTDVSDDGNPWGGEDDPTVTPLTPPLQLSINGTYSDYNNDGFVDVGDVINYSFIVFNAGQQTFSNITITSNELTIIGGPIELGPFETNSTSFSAVYALTQDDINNGYVVKTAIAQDNTFYTFYGYSSVYLNISDGIRMTAFVDTNGNGVKDSNENIFRKGQFHYELNDNGVMHNITSWYGTHYIYESNPANSFDISYSIDDYVAAQYTLATNAYSNITVPAGSGITDYYFPVTALPYTDLSVYVVSAQARPGFPYVNKLIYKNNGNQAISGTVNFNNDNAVLIVDISKAGTVANATGFSYAFTNLQPNNSDFIDVTMAIPVIPTVALGQVLNTTVSGTTANDAFPGNNHFEHAEILVGSYDPNDKSESHGGEIVHSTFTADDYLTYTIRFENTGTAEAINVKVNDILDQKLDENSVRMVDASAPYTLDRVGNNLNWKFDGIALAPSVENSNIGKGYIVFQVKPKPGYSLGDVIPNTASIYFDFNPAIVTNTVSTAFVSVLSADQFDDTNFTFYPNPVSDRLNISLKENIRKVSVTDVTGKLIIAKDLSAPQATIDLSQLASGVYFVTIKADRKSKTVKVIKG
ncbi:MAG: T9SS type A sorting domain-containing protein [Flavobacterium sp.]|nr:T9SS type A sorting domain-containing protein [Flavobacterium sp.]